MSHTSSSSRQCPQCGGGLNRVPRFDEDRITEGQAPVHRYRCAGPSCDWEGTLSVVQSKAAAPDHDPGRQAVRRRRAWSRIWAFSAAGVACVALAGAGVRLYRHAWPAAALSQGERHTVPFGVSDFGRPLSTDHPYVASTGPVGEAAVLKTAASGTGNATPSAGVRAGAPAVAPARVFTDADALELREGCAWGNPGRNPYKGTVAQALRGARLPDEVVGLLQDKIRDGKATDRLEISNDRIRAVQADVSFEPRAIKMTFGNTLCLNTRVNFNPGHIERADLYEVADAKGVTYSVMVPYVCGNVSVLGARAEREDEVAAEAPAETAVLGASAERPAPAPVRKQTPPGVQGVQNIVRVGERNVVVGGPNLPLAVTAASQAALIPEPDTLASMLGGLALIGVFARRRARRG